MREIKFRAWDLFQNKMFENVSTGTITVWGDNGESASSKNCVFMQYTNLKDRNGKEIYEGDVVKSQFPYNDTFLINIDTVVWRNETSSFMLGPRMFHDKLILEIIGNIYENPELLS